MKAKASLRKMSVGIGMLAVSGSLLILTSTRTGQADADPGSLSREGGSGPYGGLGLQPWVVGETLTVTVTADGGRATGYWSATMPDSATTLAGTGPALRAQNTITYELELQSEGVGLTVLTPRSGEFDLGLVEPGDYTLLLRYAGQEIGKLPFTANRVQTAIGDDAGKPVITSIRIDSASVVVTVQVPAGVRKVTLESRTRLGAGAWRPVGVQRLDGAGKEVTFELVRSEKVEVLRVRGDSQEALPASFYAGVTNYNGQASASAPTSNLTAGDLLRAMGDANPTGPESSTAGREVVESDIWRIRGDTLYFFNQFRGLQVIDLSQPDAPALLGTLALPAAGEQMYVLDAQYVLLMARNGCGWGPDEASQGLIVDVSNGAPQVAASVTIPGYIQESRLVGTALYVASQTYRRVVQPTKPEGGAVEQWEWGSVVSSFDLSNPMAPVARGSLWYPGYGNVIMATDKFLFVANQNVSDWWKSVLAIIDIASPDGTMTPKGTVYPAGRVADKFKMNVNGEVFTVISESWLWGSGRRVSVLETYSLADPAAPRKLGQVEVGHGEGLFATRFDENRVYIVTFLRIDPLWVVDLSDPVNPRIAGHLEVPGWSTYIQPLGDRLVAVGVDNSNSWKVAVSLFDVRDPAQPGLLAKVPLGENSSWSEANYDEKALTVLADAGLILVPYQSWSTNGYASRVQLIDLGTDTLVPRGLIEHTFQPRRATVHGTRIVSLTGRELLTVNATDRDHPQVTATLDLSWGVNRVLLSGDYLIEVSDAASWSGAPNPWLRVVRNNEPERALSRLELTNGLPVVGASVREDKLYLAQAQGGDPWWPVIWTEGEGGQPVTKTNTSTLVLSVYDLSSLPALTLVSQSEVTTAPLGWGLNLAALWPKPGLLVWSGGGGSWWWGPFLDVGLARPVGDALFWRPWWGGGSSGRLFAFDVTQAAAPRFLSETDLTTTNGWWSFSEAFTVDGVVSLSHQGAEFVPATDPSGQPKLTQVVSTDRDGALVTNTAPTGVWITKYYLDVIDYADPTTPTVRRPVNIPGALQGISHHGALLYTSGPHWDATGNTDWMDYLDVSAYDGVSAALVTSLKLPGTWPRPLLVQDGTVWLGDGTSNELEAWAMNEAGQLIQRSAVKLSLPAQSLAAFGGLLAVQLNQRVELYAANPAAPTLLAGGTPAGCVWPDLTRAAGSPTQGLWAPLQDYGVFSLPLGVKP